MIHAHKPIFLILVQIFALTGMIPAANLTISQVEFRQLRATTGVQKVKMTLSWDHAWHNDRNHDAAWIVVKFIMGDAGYRHAKIAKEGHQILHDSGVSAFIAVPEDQTGFFIYPAEGYRGRVEWTVEVVLDPQSLSRIPFQMAACAVYGMEMVYIPEGPFTLGDPDTTALRFGSFYRADGSGNPAGLFEIDSEHREVEVGQEAGNLYYRAETPAYQGDQQGPVPASFPKGYQAFYIMKYELQQGQYVAFLNTLGDGQTAPRANFGGKTYEKYRGSIFKDHGQYFAGSPHRPCNYISWDDGLAFADWAGLRPMTEWEFTKACRGSSQPVAGEYPWNSSSKARLQRAVHTNNELIMLNDLDEGQLNENTREVFGASYYWVMDLAGSLWERVITIGDEKGRAFTGAHGDGSIGYYGYANVNDWPMGDNETGGYGFRGGGYYRHGHNYNDFLPHSPIAYRTFGAWSGGYRTKAYSNRYVRTAE